MEPADRAYEPVSASRWPGQERDHSSSLITLPASMRSSVGRATGPTGSLRHPPRLACRTSFAPMGPFSIRTAAGITSSPTVRCGSHLSAWRGVRTITVPGATPTMDGHGTAETAGHGRPITTVAGDLPAVSGTGFPPRCGDRRGWSGAERLGTLAGLRLDGTDCP